MSESRTTKSIKNSIIALFFFAIQFVLSFYSRKIFLEYLGEEILGLNTTATNILQFLNLAELGISSAVSFSLYSPLHRNDELTISEIVTLQGKIYRRIAAIIIFGAILVMFFFPMIFKKIALPLWYAYASFGVLLFSALLGYFVNYKQIVLTASQRDYKIQYSVGTCNIIKVITQIVAIAYSSYPYLWWLILEVLFAILSSVVLQIMVKRTFPFLKDLEIGYSELRFKYGYLIKKTKQVFFHNIGGFALSQSSPLVIYAFSSLSLVAVYGNYLLISTGIMRLVNAVFNSMGAGIGDLIAEGDQKKMMKVFYELFSFRFLISATLTFTLISLGQPFIVLWIGNQYLLPLSTLIIIALTLFIRLNRFTVNQFLAGSGQYQDILAPLIEASLNIGLSILLGYYFGLNGILSGVLISLICVVEIWKPFFLFRYGLHESLKKYAVNYFLHLIGGIGIGYILTIFILRQWNQCEQSWITFILISVMAGIAYIVGLSIYLFLISSGFRNILSRIKRLI